MAASLQNNYSYIIIPMLKKIATHPQYIFLFDSIGAFTTALLLFSIGFIFPTLFGLPQYIHFVLAAIALLFCLFSYSCFYRQPVNWKPYLKAIMLANVLYCVLTAVLIFSFRSSISLWGILYFGGELIVILSLVYFEYMVLTKRTS